MTAHSPTPFRTDGSLIGYREGEDCPPQSWTLIARIEQGIGNRPADQHDQREANAAFIVAACNAHADLLAALEELERETSHAHVIGAGLPHDCAVCRAIKRARAAIEQAKG